MPKWTAKKRRETPAKDKAGPHNSFPVETQEDLNNAARLIGHAADPEAVKRRLKGIAKRKNLKLPASWEEEEKPAAMSSNVGFDAGEGVEFEDDDENVVYENAILFRVGDYPDKKFSLTEEEADAAIECFQPVPNELQHINSQYGEATILDGKLGHVRDVWREGKKIMGEVAIPQWLDGVWEGPKKVSAVWDRATKTIKGLGLVIKGRVPDAALMASFACAHPDEMAAIFEDDGGYETPHGARLIQDLHDTCARGGAMCSGTRQGTQWSAASSAGFTAQREREALDKFHKLTTKYGAKCRMGRPAYMSDDDDPEEGSMSKLAGKFRALFGDQLPAETEDTDIDEFLGELHATFAKKAPTESEEDDESDEDWPAKQQGRMKKFAKAGEDADSEDDEENDLDLEEEKKRMCAGKGKKKMMKTANMAATALRPSAAEREAARLRERVEMLERQNLESFAQNEAVQFADSVKDRIFPTERENLITLYQRAMIDDQQSKVLVTFSDAAGKAKQGSRVDSIRASYVRRPPITSLYREYVHSNDIPDGSVVLFNRQEAALREQKEVGFTPDEKGEKAMDAALLNGYGELGRKAVKYRKTGEI